VEPTHGTGGLGLVISELERATIAACGAFHAGQIGEGLRRFSVASRSGGPGELDADQLVKYEVNAGPPITRTMRTLQMWDMGGGGEGTAGAEDLLRWLPGAVAAVQRLAQLCWQPISQRERTLVFDEDDLGPAASWYLPATRSDETGPSLQFEGLAGSEALDAWKQVSRRARETDAYAAAAEAGQALKEPALARELQSCRDACARKLQEVVEGPPITLGEVIDTQKRLVRHAYDDASAPLREAAFAIRAYSELINHLLWAVLCAAGSRTGLKAIDGDLGAVRVDGAQARPQHLWIVMDLDVWIGNPPTPFVIEKGLPCDGLYVMDASLTQWEVTGLVDIRGTRIASLERGSRRRAT
jgi:hypothetical protein